PERLAQPDQRIRLRLLDLQDPSRQHVRRRQSSGQPGLSESRGRRIRLGHRLPPLSVAAHFFYTGRPRGQRSLPFRLIMLRELDPRSDFIPRHLGPSPVDQARMLAAIGVSDLPSLIREVVPSSILQRGALQLPGPQSEAAALADLKAVAERNQRFRSYIGQGYYGTHVPNVI